MASTDKTVFDAAFRSRIAETSNACVGCGKCFEACPITEPAGLAGSDSVALTTGIKRFLEGGEAPKDSAQWARACILSGDCLKACDYGVNPRLLLTMARMRLSEHELDAKTRRGQGVKAFAKLGRDVKILSRLQLDDTQLARLGQPKVPTQGASTAPSAPAPDVVFYTGCNVLKTPHIALLSLDILEALGITYSVLGGPSHCCGILQYRAGDFDAANRMSSATIEKFIATGTSAVVAWCPSCQVQFEEINLPTYERATGQSLVDMTPFMLFLKSRLPRLKSALTEPVQLKIALHAHPGVDGVPDAAREILRAIPGIELIDLDVPEVGLMSNSLRTLPDFQKELHQRELEAAEKAGVDALVAVYHADHRELCAHERDRPFEVLNVLEIIAASMGLHQHDRFKELKLKQDADAILADCEDLVVRHGISKDVARDVVATAMLADQPLPLRRSEKPTG
ncbi:MAG: (Fe-S)-binding protein [Filomicrobium sp.]